MADRLNITRRDFLNGVALSLAAGTSLSPLELLAQLHGRPECYPPGLTGLRGSHLGSFEVAHAVAIGGAKFALPKERTDATYDLVVVGGGISGLAAAFLYRQQAGAGKKVLVIDNHDDFGGHAKRNEFTVAGRRLIGYGGSQSLEAPTMYSAASRQLLRDVGIDVSRFYDYFDSDWSGRHHLRPGIYFSREVYGKDLTLQSALWNDGNPPDPSSLHRLVADYPIATESRKALVMLMQTADDFLAGMSRDEKKALLAGISYSQFLRDHVGVPEEVVALVRDEIRGYWGVGWDAISALEACRYDQPGTRGLDLGLDDDGLYSSEEPYIFHFPDGNAGVARALVRALVPDAVPGNSMEDLATAWVDYAQLDTAAAATRIRLNCTAIDVRHSADQSHVDVTCVRGGKSQRVRGRHAVLACYNRVIPFICSEVPEDQVEAIAYATKTPLAYMNIAVRNWRAFAERGVDGVYVPQPVLMHSFGLDFPVSMGDYQFTNRPDEPAVIHGSFAATVPDEGLTQREQNRLGQRRILEMSFDDFESKTFRQLDGALGSAGFDIERDIAALTVNRWPHGYAYEYSELSDPPAYDREHGPHVTGRRRIGRISIANSDASAYAYADGAIDAAYRAVNEQLSL